MKTIRSISEYVKHTIDNSNYISLAFELGLRHKQIPEGVEVVRTYRPVCGYYEMYWTIEHISKDGEDWQPLYRQLRELGWNRKSVERKGGSLTYVFHRADSDLPEEFQERTLILHITISTCEQVKVGTKVVDVFETRCADWKSPEGEDLEGLPEGMIGHFEEPPPPDIEVAKDDMQQYGTPGEEH